MQNVNETVRKMVSAMVSAADGRMHSVWLYGSLLLDDFRPGWSDIDFIAYTNGALSEPQAGRLLTLRQELCAACPENPLLACFEGAFLPFGKDVPGRIVYWGTGGQRIVTDYAPDPFARWQLARRGLCLYGNGDRSIFACPDRAEMVSAIRRHYESIRKYAGQTGESLYSCGWLLDIARCVYTLRFSDVISKTAAGEWALAEGIFPDAGALERTLLIRREPMKYKQDRDTRVWLGSLGPTVQRYADVLEKELDGAG
jgi:hypothetical protein